MRKLFVLALVCLLLVTGFTPIAARAQGTDDQNATAAAAAAEKYLNYAVAGDYNSLFDYLHPDVLTEVPRTVALKLFATIYGETKPQAPTIESVKIGAYTWPVNGKTYDDAAEVTYTQRFTNQQGQAQTLETTMNLVPVDGTWRWFFGNSRAYIAEASARFAPPEQTGATTDIDQLLNLVVNDLDNYYRTVFQSSRSTYESPKVVVVGPGQAASTACGPAQPGFWAFYCPPDGTVYLDKQFLGDLNQRYGDFSVAFVIGHEWAHHIQTLLGIDRAERSPQVNEVFSIELELLADCMAGTWARDMDTRHLLDTQDLSEATAFIFERIGDPDGIDEFDPQAHGSADQRLSAFSDGYDGGFTGCQLGGLSPIRAAN